MNAQLDSFHFWIGVSPERAPDPDGAFLILSLSLPKSVLLLEYLSIILSAANIQEEKQLSIFQ